MSQYSQQAPMSQSRYPPGAAPLPVRQSASRQPRRSAAPMANPQQVTTPQQQAEVAEIQRMLSKLRENLSTLQYLLERIRSVTSSGEEARVQSQIDEYTEASRVLLETTRKRIKHMADKGAKPKTPQEQVRRNQQLALARQLLATAQKFQSLQLNFKSDVVDKLKRQYKIVRPDAAAVEVDNYVLRAAEHSQSNNVFQQAALSGRPQALSAYREAQTQQHQLRALNQSIEELVSLFQEMQVLIDTQGEQVNQIQVNSEDVVVNMESASKEMSKAIVSRKRARKRAWCISIILFVILTIVIAIIVLKLMGKI